jgi:3-hydroxyacyl-[acyl-carrier-protein] dehydratase
MPSSHLKIQDLLPHRHPFLFVDQIISLQPGRSVKGIFRVPGGHPFVKHTGNVRVFPPILVVEALGQVAGICIGHEPPEPLTGSRPLGYLARIDQCTFEHPVHGEEDLLLAASLNAHFGPLYKFDATAKVGDKTVVQAALTLYAGS